MIYFDVLFCPNCNSNLFLKKKSLDCKSCLKSFARENNLIKMQVKLCEDDNLSIKKWDKIYNEQLEKGEYKKNYQLEQKLYLKDTLKQLMDVKKLDNVVYLELGCGSFFIGPQIAKKCKLIIGVDYSESALKIAKAVLEKKKIKNYLLIQADILKMPIKDNKIDIIYGGGVIEHFKDTQTCVDELFRILKKKGVSFNTVPYLNIGSLTYRQIWGNIPNIFILKQIAEFVHIKIFRGKYMKYGYEYSFLKFTLKKIHHKSGFRNVKIDKFQTTLSFEFIPKILRPFLIHLAQSSSLFWPMIKVVAIK